MGNVLTIFGFATLIGLVNGTNFMVVFIALVIVFFLLGTIIGFNINSRKRSTKDDITTDRADNTGRSRAMNTVGQDSRDNTIRQINSSYQRHSKSHSHSHSHHKHHKHSSGNTENSIR